MSRASQAGTSLAAQSRSAEDEGYLTGCRQRSAARRDHQPAAFTLAAIINRENLVRVFENRRSTSGPGAGIDGLSYVDFSKREFGDCAGTVAEAIHAGRWRPRPGRQVTRPKDGGGVRTLSLRCLVDRTVSAAVAEMVKSRIDPLLGDGCYGYRPKRCVHDMFAQIAHRAESERLTVITQDDIRDAFPSVVIDHAVADYARHTIDPGLLRLIEVILRGYQSRRVGIDQGDPLSPCTLNQRLYYCMDLPALGPAVSGTTRRYRYADNLAYQGRCVTEGREALRWDRVLLEQARPPLKGVGNEPIDLRRRGARINILGLDLSWNENRGLLFGLDGKAYRRLGVRLEEAHEGPYPVEAAKMVIQGWMEAKGPAFESDGLLGILDSIREIAARAGFREVGSRAELEHGAERALRHWNKVKEEVVCLRG